MQKLVILCCLMVVAPAASWPSSMRQSIPDYGSWRALSFPSREAYISGAFDMFINDFPSEPANKADLEGIKLCANAAGFTPKILIEIVDRRYFQHNEEWGFGPSPILVAGLIDTCKVQINSERRKVGLPTH